MPYYPRKVERKEEGGMGEGRDKIVKIIKNKISTIYKDAKHKNMPNFG